METDLQSRLSVPFGLVLSLIMPFSKDFNLRREEFSPKTMMNLKRTLTFTLAAALLVVTLFTFNIYHRVYVKEKRYAALQENMRGLYVEAFPGATAPVKGRELAQMGQKIKEESEKYGWLDNLTKGGRILEPLLVLSKTISGFPTTKIDNLSIEEDKIRIDGQTSSFEMVDRMEKKLVSTGSFKSVKLVGAKMDQKQKAVKFNFVMEKNG
jgi:hypothetical protein